MSVRRASALFANALDGPWRLRLGHFVLHGAPSDLPDTLRFGVVIPKRLAPRAVTRNLLKRQCRAAFALATPAALSGVWVMRLNAPFARETFRSAASPALRSLARAELSPWLSLAQRAVRRFPRLPKAQREEAAQ